jgi:hypothetical protein
MNLIAAVKSVFCRRRAWRNGAVGIGIAVLLATAPAGVMAQEEGALLIDSFEADPVSTFPSGWVFVAGSKDVKSYEETRNEGERVVVRENEGNKFVRLITKGEVLRYTLRNGDEYEWNLEQHPRLAWRWRAQALPEGASEKDDDTNDAGGAIYVTFGTDWLGRPKSIKYTYSSSLPVGTVVDYGNLYVIVVDSANEPRTGEWKTMQRNVIQDYRQVFGDAPPDRPEGITMWSDSDTTGDIAKVDIDDIRLLPPSQRD